MRYKEKLRILSGYSNTFLLKKSNKITKTLVFIIAGNFLSWIIHSFIQLNTSRVPMKCQVLWQVLEHYWYQNSLWIVCIKPKGKLSFIREIIYMTDILKSTDSRIRLEGQIWFSWFKKHTQPCSSPVSFLFQPLPWTDSLIEVGQNYLITIDFLNFSLLFFLWVGGLWWGWVRGQRLEKPVHWAPEF